MKIKNSYYNKFLREGIIELIEPETITKVIEGIKHKFQSQARSLVIALYATGARPCEILDLKGESFQRENTHLIISVTGRKKGRPRKIHLPINNKLYKELWEYASSLPPNMFVFHRFKTRYGRIVKHKNGETSYRMDTTDGLRYWFKIWFSPFVDITPYCLRHNRFSKMAEKGASMQEMKFIKGARSLSSIDYYTHLSSRTAKKVIKYMD